VEGVTVARRAVDLHEVALGVAVVGVRRVVDEQVVGVLEAVAGDQILVGVVAERRRGHRVGRPVGRRGRGVSGLRRVDRVEAGEPDAVLVEAAGGSCRDQQQRERDRYRRSGQR
jgi:hypothetical protein